jgi:uncharacterized Zn finger protein (UPF0148 family)
MSKKQKPQLEECVDCKMPTFHHKDDDPHGVPLCRVCEYLRQAKHAEIEARAYQEAEQ